MLVAGVNVVAPASANAWARAMQSISESTEADISRRGQAARTRSMWKGLASVTASTPWSSCMRRTNPTSFATCSSAYHALPPQVAFIVMSTPTPAACTRSTMRTNSSSVMRSLPPARPDPAISCGTLR